MTNQSKYRIHFSSLRQEDRIEMKQMVENLQGSVDDNLTFFTKFLVCPTVDNHKHRVD